MSDQIEKELSKLREDFSVQMDKAIRENGNALGKVLTQRFEALEAIVAILAHSASAEVQKKVSEEIANRKAHWLK